MDTARTLTYRPFFDQPFSRACEVLEYRSHRRFGTVVIVKDSRGHRVLLTRDRLLAEKAPYLFPLDDQTRPTVSRTCDSITSISQSHTQSKENLMASKTTTPAAAAEPTKAPEPVEKKNPAWMAGVLSEKLGQAVTAATVRRHLRTLVKNGKFEKGDTGWTFTGVKDPVIQLVIDQIKQEAKEKAEPKAKATATEKPVRRPRKAKATPEPAEEDDLDELDIDEI